MEPIVLAGSAVVLLAPYLAEGGKELAKKVGGEAGDRIVRLYDKIKAKLTGGGAEALEDLKKQPEDADSQAALRVQIKDALEADPAFQAEVAKLVAEIETRDGDTIRKLIANVTGDRNVTNQIVGSGNMVR
jgi:hypothetical protein